MKTRFSLPLLALSALAIAQERPPIKYDEGQIQALAARMNKLVSKNWQEGFAFGQELAELPSPLGYQILRDNWNKGASLDARKQMFKGFVFDTHPDALLVLNLGMRDPHLSMQMWSMSYLKMMFMKDFTSDFAAYSAWFYEMKALPTKEIKQRSVRATMDGLLTVPDTELGAAAERAVQAFSNAAIAPYPKMADLVDRLIDSPTAGLSGMRLAAVLLASNNLPPAETTKRALRLMDRKEILQSPEALDSLMDLGTPALLDRSLEILRAKVASKTDNTYGFIGAMLDAGDPRVVPLVIELMADASPETLQEMTNALRNNIGVQPPDPVTADAWKTWLVANRSRFEMKFDEKALPSFKIDAVPTLEYIPDGDDVKDIPSAAFLVGNDPMKRYFISGKMEPGKPKNVLIVMPGGPGTPEFHPFVKRIQKNVLGEDWIVVQPIAPMWDNAKERVVWPSAASPYPPAKFTMETFLDGMLDELPARHKVKVGKTYMLGWSSSGPAIYSYAGHGKHTIDGAVVAMSVFNPEYFGDAKSLAVKRFYLYHSPEDFIKMSNPEAAKARLESLKIPVALTTYEGGHGWGPGVYDSVAAGLKYLEGGR
ncbi:hypothetical protein EON81_02560 [bacterium]|nr:MAG: hypothetical protein EON81_02560 [bacterium]